MAEIFSRAKLQDRNRMIAALRGGSTKKLVATGTQVAVQQGVQTRDLMKTIYAIKRDQMKGFDYLAPEGFYDADPDSLVITMVNALKADPHLQNDKLQVVVAMVEATDDSFLFAKSLRAVQDFVFTWNASSCVWMADSMVQDVRIHPERQGPGSPGPALFPSITVQPGVDPWTIQNYDVPVIRTGLDFLNAKVDDPGVRFNEMRDIIDAFTFPRLTGRLPITLLRKMVAQNIPIKQSDAEALDVRISSKIHAILGMPFSPNSKILTLPVSHHGLGFPSIARINAGIAVDGLAHDLNHHITAYRSLARITLAEPHRRHPHSGMHESRLRNMNGRSYYRWILELAREGRAIMRYTRGHSAELTVPAQMNREADYYASGAQRFIELVPIAPTPTFSMDTFTFHTSADGWIESNTRSFLYARSGQLPTAQTLESRAKVDSAMCRLGCCAVESMHHIFVECIHFADWRYDAATELLARTALKLTEAGSCVVSNPTLGGPRDGHGYGLGYEAVNPDSYPENPNPNPRGYESITGLS
ncbi:hypothetical protein B0H13DRAFT_2241019 [Mycena leptocephala]|nr:hypothetical protein B0H13DRAFT_2241019 [Mycena leptocephala]